MTTRRISRAVSMGLLLLGAILLAGCSTTTSPTRLQIEMTRSGGAVIKGAAFGPRQVAMGLRQAGARPDTRIEVTLPAGTDEATIEAFARTMSTAGYRLVHFRTGKRAASFVK